MLIVKGAATCGEGWAAGLKQAEADYIVLGADDAIPFTPVQEIGSDARSYPGAIEAGIEAVDGGIYPAPRILKSDGRLESCGSLGAGGAHLGECPNGSISYMSSYPICTREMWQEIGEIPPIHYYVDDFLGYRARVIGLSCEVVRGYAFTHLEELHGRSRVVARVWEDRVKCLETITGSESSTRYETMVPIG